MGSWMGNCTWRRMKSGLLHRTSFWSTRFIIISWNILLSDESTYLAVETPSNISLWKFLFMDLFYNTEECHRREEYE